MFLIDFCSQSQVYEVSMHGLFYTVFHQAHVLGAHVQISLHMYMHICICIYIYHGYTCEHLCLYTYVHNKLCRYAHRYTYINVHICECTYIHMYIYTY